VNSSFESASQPLFCDDSQESLGNVQTIYILENVLPLRRVGEKPCSHSLQKRATFRVWRSRGFELSGVLFTKGFRFS
jgi:hypothetical protein